MKLFKININIILTIAIWISTFTVQAQLSFCTGNSGDPIFTEDFGTGTTNGPQLSAGSTTYFFINGSPNDGQYTISSNTAYYDWFDVLDHTVGDTNGKSLIVNADFVPGEFFRRTVTGLCESTEYEFSSWLINLLPTTACGGLGIPINVGFQIWDSTDTNLLASGDTGNIVSGTSPNWQEFALTFQTLTGQTSVILKMINNAAGGCGNDLAIDDITFKTCGDTITVNNALGNSGIEIICSYDTPFSTTLTANPDFSVFTTHNYQWEESIDGIVWTDIAGAISNTYSISGLTNSMFYRVKVAEFAANVSNSLCNVLSETYEVIVVPQPVAPISNGDKISCDNNIEELAVSVPNNAAANWYDAQIGGNLLLSNSTSFSAAIAGTYYAETVLNTSNCVSDSRTPVSISFVASPVVIDEEIDICRGDVITINSGILNATYLWSTQAITESISIDSGGIYTVEITNSDDCTSIKTITVRELEAPIIESVTADGYDIIVTTSNFGDFEYSLDGIFYRINNRFFQIENGLYTVFVRERNGCGVDTLTYLHFVIPKFFTPNADTFNDTWDLKGIEYFESSQVFIFDCYGKLLKNATNKTFAWDGTFNNILLPTNDYWYTIILDNQEFQGHFTLKR